MKIIDGKSLAMGRLASFAAKELLKGEEIIILNCNQVIITGNKKNIESEFDEKRSKMGSSLKGPKHRRSSEQIVKRAVRGMLPDHRKGRGRIVWKKLKCFNEIPKEYEGKENFKMPIIKKAKSIKVQHLSKK
jgi:ribosomal protein uL13